MAHGAVPQEVLNQQATNDQELQANENHQGANVHQAQQEDQDQLVEVQVTTVSYYHICFVIFIYILFI